MYMTLPLSIFIAHIVSSYCTGHYSPAFDSYHLFSFHDFSMVFSFSMCFLLFLWLADSFCSLHHALVSNDSAHLSHHHGYCSLKPWQKGRKTIYSLKELQETTMTTQNWASCITWESVVSPEMIVWMILSRCKYDIIQKRLQRCNNLPF